MANYNSISIIGHVGRDPDMKYNNDGNALCKFSVAVTDKRGGNETTQWFNVAAFGRLAETCNQYVRKGMAIMIVGPVTLNQYVDRNGEHRASLDVVARDVQFLSRVDSAQQGGQQPSTAPQTENDIPW